MDPHELNEANKVHTSWDWGNVKRMVDMLVYFYELT